MNYLLDTNVISETRRQRPDARVMSFLAVLPIERLYLSVITLGELHSGILRLDAGRRRREMEVWLKQAEQNFSARVLPIDRETALLWGELNAAGFAAGRPLNVADGLLAATAKRHGLTVLTRNTRDFELSGVPIANPWEESE